MTEISQGDQSVSKPEGEQTKQRPSHIKHAARPLRTEDLKAILGDLEQHGEIEKAALVRESINAPETPTPPKPISVNQSAGQSLPPRRETILPPTTSYPAGQGRQNLENLPIPPIQKTPSRGNQGGK